MAVLKYENAHDVPDTIGEYLAKGRDVDVVGPDTSVLDVIKIMNTKGYSQMPVCEAGKRLLGYISWEEIFKLTCERYESINSFKAGDLMNKNLARKVIGEDTPTSEAMEFTNTEEFLLVVDNLDLKVVKGIITNADFAEIYSRQVRAFLVLAKIEDTLRRILAEANIDLEKVRNLAEESRPDKNTVLFDASELSFNNVRYIMNNIQVWPKLSLSKYFDRQSFFNTMGEVKEIRNKVMHHNLPKSQEKFDSYIKTLDDFLKRLTEFTS
jgi:CBS domain-containing protein